VIGLRLDFVDKSGEQNKPWLKEKRLTYVNTTNGNTTQVIQIPGGKSDLSLSGTAFSADGTLFFCLQPIQRPKQSSAAPGSHSPNKRYV